MRHDLGGLDRGDAVGPIVCEVFVSILEELEATWPNVKRDVMLVGSAPLAIRGLRDVKDLDVVATEEAFRSLLHALEAKEFKLQKLDPVAGVTRYTAFGQVQIAPTLAMHAADVPLSSEKAWVGAEQWNGWRVLSRKDCLLIKRTLKREKDEEDVRLLLCWDPRRVLGLDGRVRIDRTGMTEVVEMAKPLPAPRAAAASTPVRLVQKAKPQKLPTHEELTAMVRSRLAANRYGQHLLPGEVEDEMVGAMRDVILDLSARGLLKDEG